VKKKKHFSLLLNVRRVSEGTHGIVVGSGTVLQARRSRIRKPTRSLDFSVDSIIPAEQWPWY
jgi:hypothetical protein